VKAAFSARVPTHGKTFALLGTAPTLSDDRTYAPDRKTCRATLGGRKLAGGCSWRLPANSGGQTLNVTVTSTLDGLTGTRTYTFWVK
jgi:hypothetical protein